jgi:uncharacterized metal-binding protein YceD (DUF177 family)
VTAPEWSHRIPLERIGSDTVQHNLIAGEAERVALAKRFGLIAIDRLNARFDLHRDANDPIATGRISADVTQACIATGEPVAQTINAPTAIRFVDLGVIDAEDLELEPSDHDEMEHDGQAVDLGEAAAQTLALALDPYPRSPAAAAALKAAGVIEEKDMVSGAFAGLKGLLDSGSR